MNFEPHALSFFSRPPMRVPALLLAVVLACGASTSQTETSSVNEPAPEPTAEEMAYSREERAQSVLPQPVLPQLSVTLEDVPVPSEYDPEAIHYVVWTRDQAELGYEPIGVMAYRPEDREAVFEGEVPSGIAHVLVSAERQVAPPEPSDVVIVGTCRGALFSANEASNVDALSAADEPAVDALDPSDEPPQDPTVPAHVVPCEVGSGE